MWSTTGRETTRELLLTCSSLLWQQRWDVYCITEHILEISEVSLVALCCLECHLTYFRLWMSLSWLPVIPTSIMCLSYHPCVCRLADSCLGPELRQDHFSNSSSVQLWLGHTLRTCARYLLTSEWQNLESREGDGSITECILIKPIVQKLPHKRASSGEPSLLSLMLTICTSAGLPAS